MATIFDGYNEAREAEEAALGAMLILPELVNTAAAMLDRSDFGIAGNAELYGVMLDMQRESRGIDLVTLLNRLGGGDEIKKHLVRLSDQVGVITNFEDYCRLVKNASLGRKAAAVLANADFRGNGGGDIVENIRKASMQLAELIQGAGRRRYQTLQEVIDKVWGDIVNCEPPKDRTDTGISGLDAILDGIYPSDLVTIAASTGVGKTAFMLGLILNLAKAGKKISLYTLEMTAEQNVQRMFAREAFVDMTNIKNPQNLGRGEMEALAGARRELYKNQMDIYANGGLTVADIETDYMSKGGFGDVIVVDHIGLMRCEGKKSLTEETTQIMKDLRALAMKLNKPLIALCQLNRDGADGEPQMRHLRQSGEIEQSSSTIIMLWQLPDYERTKHIGVKVPKNRQGAPGRLCMKFDAAKMSFYEVSGYEWNNEAGQFAQKKKQGYNLNE